MLTPCRNIVTCLAMRAFQTVRSTHCPTPLTAIRFSFEGSRTRAIPAIFHVSAPTPEVISLPDQEYPQLEGSWSTDAIVSVDQPTAFHFDGAGFRLDGDDLICDCTLSRSTSPIGEPALFCGPTPTGLPSSSVQHKAGAPSWHMQNRGNSRFIWRKGKTGRPLAPTRLPGRQGLMVRH